ncbi:hypothetical protein KSP40_PGU000252 [Platanthera guangdongensis]|uniref:Uncharacterized protein n=1 Tax=Platanthera guangdongensis TaxID=2320717 RepID=A0ABR2LVE9_9ASPA
MRLSRSSGGATLKISKGESNPGLSYLPGRPHCEGFRCQHRDLKKHAEGKLASATPSLAIDLRSLLSTFDTAYYSCLPEAYAVQPSEDLSKALVPFSCCDPSIISAFILSVTAASDDVTAAAENKAVSASEIVLAAAEDNVPTAADEFISQDSLMTEAVVFEPATRAAEQRKDT